MFLLWANDALMDAVKSRKIELVYTVIFKGAKIDGPCEALDYAISSRTLRIAEVLVQNGAIVKDKSCLKADVITLAALLGCLDLIKFLLQNGMDINVTNGTGETSLLSAVQRNHLELAEYLVKNGADLYIQDIFGETAFTEAIFHANLRMVEMLIQNGVNVNHSNSEGRTPLMSANTRYGLYTSKDKYCQVIRILVGNGANIYAKDCRGKTARALARECNQDENVEYFTGIMIQHKEIALATIMIGRQMYLSSGNSILPIDIWGRIYEYLDASVPMHQLGAKGYIGTDEYVRWHILTEEEKSDIKVRINGNIQQLRMMAFLDAHVNKRLRKSAR